MLPSTTVKKMMRESFATPNNDLRDIISFAYGTRQPWFRKLMDRLKVIDRLECGLWADEENDDCSLSLLVRGVKDGRKPHDYFRLKFKTQFDVSEGLWINDESRRRRGSEPIPKFGVYDVKQIEQFVEVVKARQDRIHLHERRKQKVASLQQTGLMSRLKELGAEHDFAFAMNETVREVRLSIRIGGRKTGFNFMFPKSKLANVLDEVPDLVNTLKNLQSLGMKFKSENRSWRAKQGKWIEPPKKAVSKVPKSKQKKSVTKKQTQR